MGAFRNLECSNLLVVGIDNFMVPFMMKSVHMYTVHDRDRMDSYIISLFALLRRTNFTLLTHKTIRNMNRTSWIPTWCKEAGPLAIQSPTLNRWPSNVGPRVCSNVYSTWLQSWHVGNYTNGGFHCKVK